MSNFHIIININLDKAKIIFSFIQIYVHKYIKGGLLAKSRKLFFSGEVIFGGQNPKNAKKKIQKILLSQIVR